MNKIPETQYSGWQSFYNSKNEKGKLLAECVQSALNKSIDTSNNRVPKAITNVYLVEHVEIPLALIECGFLSNSKELNLLTQDDYQDKLAWGIYTGINDYFTS